MTIIFGHYIFGLNKISFFADVHKDSITNEEINYVQDNVFEENNKKIWQIEIPKIELVAPIAEGTSDYVLNKYVGHFEETQKENGNIGLAAHNRGYNVNYFSRLKELVLGDEIIYILNGNKKIYKVSLITIINDTDWTNLENTNDNRLTLITCLENEPSKRRCIQALEKEKE